MANTQLIGGKSYTMYSPEWYAAMDGNQVHEAGVAGSAAGTAAGSASVSNWQTKYPGYQTPGPYDINPALAGLSQAFGSSSSGGATSAPTVAFGGSAGGSSAGAPAVAMSALHPSAAVGSVDYTPPTEGQEGAARAAIFARGRDTAAQTASASLTGLSDALSARGLTGGGYEAGQIGGTLAREANTIGEVSRQQSENELARAADVANRQYEGRIVQRGQDIGKSESDASRELAAASTAFQGGIVQRGQNMSANDSAAGRSLDVAKTAYSGAITQREQDLQAKRDADTFQTNQAQLQLEQRKASLAGLSAALTGAAQRY